MLPDDNIEDLVQACREIVGDDLRSLVYFTADDFDQVYLKDYLSAEADIQAFVDNERTEFHRQPTHEGSELGRYKYTIRRFERGYLVCVISGSHGVFATTNQLPIEQYDDLAASVDRQLKRWAG